MLLPCYCHQLQQQHAEGMEAQHRQRLGGNSNGLPNSNGPPPLHAHLPDSLLTQPHTQTHTPWQRISNATSAATGEVGGGAGGGGAGVLSPPRGWL